MRIPEKQARYWMVMGLLWVLSMTLFFWVMFVGFVGLYFDWITPPRAFEKTWLITLGVGVLGMLVTVSFVFWPKKQSEASRRKQLRKQLKENELERERLLEELAKLEPRTTYRVADSSDEQAEPELANTTDKRRA